MVIYEVNLTINNDIYIDFRAWLNQHIDAILRIHTFIQASVFKVEQNKNADEKQLTIQYQLNNRHDLEQYFIKFAAKMRTDAINQFGNKFSATRRILELQEIIILPSKSISKT